MSKKVNPLETKRFYKTKNPTKKFLCALCSAPRSMKYSKTLNHKQIVQIVLISTALSWGLFSVVGIKSIFSIFLVWPAFEMINKLLYRKEIPCPYCGFDATWYRRDVVKANSLVKDFWVKNYPDLVNPPLVENIESETAQTSPDDSEAPSQTPVN